MIFVSPTGLSTFASRRVDLGVLKPGARADVVVLDEGLEITRVLVDGEDAGS
ncbi:MAG TPA: hypothetical protein VIM33_06615 [Gaiellaceae bacterium]